MVKEQCQEANQCSIRAHDQVCVCGVCVLISLSVRLLARLLAHLLACLLFGGLAYMIKEIMAGNNVKNKAQLEAVPCVD